MQEFRAFFHLGDSNEFVRPVRLHDVTGAADHGRYASFMEDTSFGAVRDGEGLVCAGESHDQCLDRRVIFRDERGHP